MDPDGGGMRGWMALALVLPEVARAEVTVESSGLSYPTISEAVLMALPGDTLTVGAGLYQEAVVVDRDLTIDGVGASDVTVEWLAVGNGVFETVAGVDLTMTAMTVRGMNRSAVDARSTGGITLQDLVLTGDRSSGGGLHVTGTGTELVTITDVVFDGCSAGASGGGLYAVNVRLEMQGATFTGNSATDGGGAYLDDVDLTVDGAWFAGNTATSDGGALLIADPVATVVERSTFCSNVADDGGAIWGVSATDATLRNNRVDDTVASGGALKLTGGPWTVAHNAFLSNDGGVGAVYLEFAAPSAEVKNNLFAGNLGVAVGAVQSDEPFVGYNDFFNNGSDVFGLTLDEGNLFEHPALVDWSPDGICTNDVLWPQFGSPLVDAGSPGYLFEDPDGTRADIGLYGGPHSDPVPFADGDGDGWIAMFDCDDTRAQVHPDHGEICDGLDNDCDDEVDEEAGDADLWFVDQDGDSYGDDTDPGTPSCVPVPGAVLDGRDCDDSDPYIHPGAEEFCGGPDSNCDGDPDLDAADAQAWYPDADDDGWGDEAGQQLVCGPPDPSWVLQGGDCDDGDAAVHPAAVEDCDGIDDNCSGGEEDAPGAVLWYPDLDGDGHGDGGAPPVMDCMPVANHETVGDDCDDQQPAAFPGNAEVCDLIDNDCSGTIDDGEPVRTWWPDLDGDGHGADGRELEAFCSPDGWIEVGGDCDDDEPTVHVGAAEVCDGLDNDCDGLTDLDDDDVELVQVWTDADGDGFGTGEPLRTCDPEGLATQPGDCLDVDPEVHPDAEEKPDNDIDENCDGIMEDAPSEQVHTPDEGSCGCSTGLAPGGWIWLVGLVALRRRVR